MNANEMVLAYLKREDIPVKKLADYLKKKAAVITAARSQRQFPCLVG